MFDWLSQLCIRSKQAMLLLVLPLAALSIESLEAKEILASGAPSTLYRQATSDLRKGSIRKAMKKFEKLASLHPYSQFSAMALLMQARISFERKNYSKVISVGNRYMFFYPGYHNAHYIQYLLAESYFKQAHAVDFDQASIKKAKLAYRKLLKNYPSSSFVHNAKARLRRVADQLSAKELKIGRYYLFRGNYIAAANRFATVVREYAESKNIVEAYARLVETYASLGLINEAKSALSKLAQIANKSEWYYDASRLLKNLEDTPS